MPENEGTQMHLHDLGLLENITGLTELVFAI